MRKATAIGIVRTQSPIALKRQIKILGERDIGMLAIVDSKPVVLSAFTLQLFTGAGHDQVVLLAGRFVL